MHPPMMSEASGRRDRVSPASTHCYTESPNKPRCSSTDEKSPTSVHQKMMANFPTHLGLVPNFRHHQHPVTGTSPASLSAANQSAGVDLRFTQTQNFGLTASPKKLVTDEKSSQEDNMLGSPGHHSDSDYHSSHRGSAASSPGAESSGSEPSDSGNSTADLSGIRQRSSNSSSDESEKSSPNSGLTAAQKRCRNTSPNLQKIEQVINSLTNKRKEKRSSPSDDVDGSASHKHKKFKYDSFLSSPSPMVPTSLSGGLPMGMPGLGLPLAMAGFPYGMTSQGHPSVPTMPSLQVTPPPGTSDNRSALSSLALSAATGDVPQCTEANSNFSSPLNLSGGLHISSTPANNAAAYPKPAAFNAKCVRSLLKTDDATQPINLTMRSPASDYGSGRGSNDGHVTPEPPFGKPSPNKEDATELKEEMNELHDKLCAKLKSSASSSAIPILQQYMGEVDSMETDRFRALAANVSSQQLKEAIHIYYDKERKLLANKALKKYVESLEEESISIKKEPSELAQKSPLAAMAQMSHNVTMAQTLANMAAMHQAFPGHLPPGMMGFPAGIPHPGLFPGFPGAGFPGAFPGVPHFPSGLPIPSHPEMSTPKQEKPTIQLSTPNDTSTDSGDDSFSTNSMKRKFLTPTAIEVLSEWYETNKGHPYPDEATVDELAQRANVTTNQVKKWMANKRVRSCNTLAHNGSVHPKKLEKLMQLRELSQIMPAATSTASSGEESSPASATDSPSTTTTGTDGGESSGTMSQGRRSKRMLPAKAVETLNKWYFEHLSYPYPTEEEKATLAQQGGLLISQVTCWFANKRNRSHNTKKVKQQIFEYMSQQKRDQDPAATPTATATTNHTESPAMFPVAMEMSL